jgi:two-component system, response regulator PdtaR
LWRRMSFLSGSIAEELRQLGCQVIEAGNADEAIDALRSTACIDLVATDVRMPGDRNGLDVARAARQERPGVRIVVMLGHLLPIEEHRHLIDLFVSKPTLSDQLAKAILELINAGWLIEHAAETWRRTSTQPW